MHHQASPNSPTIERTSVDHIVRLKEVLQLTGLGRSTIYVLIARGLFPAQVQLSERAVGWWYSEIVQWNRARP